MVNSCNYAMKYALSFELESLFYEEEPTSGIHFWVHILSALASTWPILM